MMYLVRFETMKANPKETILESESMNFMPMKNFCFFSNCNYCLSSSTFRTKYAVFSACADNGHLFVETIKFFPPLPLIFNSVLPQRRLSAS